MKESGIGRENGIEAFEACKFVAGPVRQFFDLRFRVITQTRKANQLS